MPTEVLVCDTYDVEALAHLKTQYQGDIKKAQCLTPSPAELNNCEALLIRSRTTIQKELLNQAPNLKYIVTATSGFDHIDLQACKQRGVKVAYTPDANTLSAAELTFTLILNLSKNLQLQTASLKAHQWREEHLRGFTLNKKTLGIVGFGRIGKKVAQMAHAFGMKVLAADPYLSDEEFTSAGVERLAFTELLLMSDILTFHVPYTKETRHMLNHQTLRLINPDAYIVNCSRGSVVHEGELALALDEEHIVGAALDVYEKEPLPKESRLRGRKNLILTPHIGAFTHEALAEASMQAVERLVEFLKLGQAKNELPLPVPWFEQILAD